MRVRGERKNAKEARHKNIMDQTVPKPNSPGSSTLHTPRQRKPRYSLKQVGSQWGGHLSDFRITTKPPPSTGLIKHPPHFFFPFLLLLPPLPPTRGNRQQPIRRHGGNTKPQKKGYQARHDSNNTTRTILEDDPLD